ncbi:MAG TPA: ATP-binding protein [Nitrososphaeraceae archaeon]|nr:ATP-binding protein [Nitrososphaeraceae archaeon]
MPTQMKVHPSFFKEFATKTWVSPTEIIKELVENAFDEDATKVLVTALNNGSIAIEDDAGMDQNGMEKFLLLGSPHKRTESVSPRLKRIRTGRYGTGRLSFLTSFDTMRIRTRRKSFTKALVINTSVLERLYTGNAKLDELRVAHLKRDGTEIVMTGAKTQLDLFKITKEIRRLAVLRQPLFEVYVKTAEKFKEWNFDGSQIVRAPEIQGHRIPLNIDSGKITGEIIIARRPLSDDERGIAVMVGNHIVTRSNFGFDTKLNRVTGFVRCDNLTTRFADKSAIIEDSEYARFNQLMKTFVIDRVIPGLTEYEDVLITREESRIYREIDKILGQAMIENLELEEEVQGYELVQVKERVRARQDEEHDKQRHKMRSDDNLQIPGHDEMSPLPLGTSANSEADASTLPSTVTEPYISNSASNAPAGMAVEVVNEIQADGTVIETRNVRKPILKKTFALKRIGYKVIPYEDESDSRYSFITENIVFVNKANPTYRAEATRGDEFLMRHVISIVAEAVAQTKHPEGKDALELQNRLVAEAIRIHDTNVTKG